MSAQSLIVTGASVRVFINGRLYGNVTSFKFTSETPGKEIHGLDSVEPDEIATTVARVSGSLGMYRLIASGGLQGIGVQPEYADLPAGKYFTLSLVERSTDTTIFEASQCRAERESWDFAAKQQSQGQLDFKGIRWGNETAR